MTATRIEIPEEKKEIQAQSQQPKMTTAAQVLEALLSNPPTKKLKIIQGQGSFNWGLFGQGGIRYNYGSNSTVDSYEQATNDIVRAEAASKLGLVLSPLSTTDSMFYIKPEDYAKQLAEAERLRLEKEERDKNQWMCTIL